VLGRRLGAIRRVTSRVRLFEFCSAWLGAVRVREPAGLIGAMRSCCAHPGLVVPDSTQTSCAHVPVQTLSDNALR